MDEDSLRALAGPAPAPKPSDRLAGKVCLVTGGASGIGRATACAPSRAMRRAVAQELRAAGTQALFVPTDVTREADAAALVAAVMARFGRLDAVLNNAGFQETRALLAEQTDAVYAKVFDTNTRALFHAMRCQIPAMLAGGGGAIVNNASVSGMRNPNPGLSLYAASKAAALMLTRSAAMEYAPQGIRINAVSPGRVVTEMMLSVVGMDMRQVAAGLPLRRMGHPEEVAAAVCWLLSEEASYVVGNTLCADGGFLAA